VHSADSLCVPHGREQRPDQRAQQVNYTYDSLKRLSTAGTAAGWGQAYTYDGFGNMTAATVTQGSGVNFTQSYDPATNHAVANPGFAYDANGNDFWPSASYDEENRMTTPDGYKNYIYDPSGKRVYESTSGTLYFYDIFGKQIWTSVINTPSVYFGNRLIVSQNGGVVTDRLGSVRYGLSQPTSYLPYGVDQTSTPNGQVKFGTYLRDGNSSTLGLDYADQRYYNPWYGRFNSPDPFKGGNAADPSSWNKYAYTRGDPINSFDPTGTDPCSADGLSGRAMHATRFMTRLAVLLISVISVGSGQTANTEKTFTSKEYGFSARYPSDWYAGAKRSDHALDIIDFPPSKTVHAVYIPHGGAEMVIGPVAAFHLRETPRTLNAWATMETARKHLTSEHAFEVESAPTGITQILEVKTDEGEPPMEVVSWYFHFHERLFKAMLLYWKGNPNADKLVQTMKQVVLTLKLSR
jgi:RHS repeat-associated protein